MEPEQIRSVTELARAIAAGIHATHVNSGEVIAETLHLVKEVETWTKCYEMELETTVDPLVRRRMENRIELMSWFTVQLLDTTGLRRHELAR